MWRTTNGCVIPTTTDALFLGDVPCIPWRKDAKVAVEPSGVIPCIVCFLDTGSRKDPTFHDRKKSRNLLNDKHSLSDSPATLKAKLRTCAGQAPSDSSQDHNEQSVDPKLVRPRVEPIRHCISVSWPNNKRRMIDNVHKLTFQLRHIVGLKVFGLAIRRLLIARCNCSLPLLHTMSFTPEGNLHKTFPCLAANTCTFPQGLPALLPSMSRLKTRNPSVFSLLVMLSSEEPSQRTAPPRAHHVVRHACMSYYLHKNSQEFVVGAVFFR